MQNAFDRRRLIALWVTVYTLTHIENNGPFCIDSFTTE